MTTPSPRRAAPLPPPPATFHFIGIGGIGMSALARILFLWGHKVTGSDIAEGPQVSTLREMGIPIVIGHDDPTFASLADVVVTNKRAIANASVELDAARAAGAAIIRRADLLGMVAAEKTCIAVAGSHGKSTTSAMLAVALRELKQDPTFAIGAILAATGTNAEPGEGAHVIVEADEFDRSFLGLFPDIAVITSVSFDHPDIYASQTEYDSAFIDFLRNVQPNGTAVIAADDPGCQRVLAALPTIDRDDLQLTTFGNAGAGDWQVDGSGFRWTILAPDGSAHPMTLQVPGRHNARNAAAAIAVLVAAGSSVADAICGVESFRGIGRRFEHKGSVNGIDVIDDYAHHPEEIAAVLQATREAYPNRRLLAVHQPHTYSRTWALLREFATSLEQADIVALMDIYGVGETNLHNVSTRQMASLIRQPVHLTADPEATAAKVRQLMQPGDVILTIGAGSVTTVGTMLLETPAPAPAEPEPAPEPEPPVITRRSRPIGTSPAGKPSARKIPDAPHLKLMEGPSMSLYTTMRVGGPADYLVRAGTASDIIAAMNWAVGEGMPVSVIGGGSNLLVSDLGIRGLVIVARTPGEKAHDLVTVEDEGETALVTIGAQVPLTTAGHYAAEKGYVGLEWGVGLPGQVGGATVNNAGAHGTEMKDHLVGVDILHPDGQVTREDAAWLQPTYRMTRIKGADRPREWIVLRTVLRLPKGDPAELVRLADEHATFRRRTQPTGACSGSTFANPPGDFSGRLIEAAGLKGYQLGAMQMSPMHANWAMNTGGATASNAWELISYVRDRIAADFGVELRPEVERIGEGW